MAASLRRQGLRAKAARKFKVTTNSNHTLPVADNLLQQDFTAQRRDQVWTGDITYIATDEGWLYLAAVLDLYSRKVVGWSMSDRMTATLVCDALRMALFRRQKPRGVILHTDRGSQYCSREHRALLEAHGLIASMSAKGNCYDNAAMESWNHSFKVEAIHGEHFATRQQAEAHVFEYIEVDYNRTRLHSTLGYLSPEQFELSHVAYPGVRQTGARSNCLSSRAGIANGRMVARVHAGGLRYDTKHEACNIHCRDPASRRLVVRLD